MTRQRRLARTRAIQRRRREERRARLQRLLVFARLAQLANARFFGAAIARFATTYQSVGVTWW